MKIIPGDTPIFLDGVKLKKVQSVELQREFSAIETEAVYYAVITVKIDHVETSVGKIELFSETD